MSKPGSVIAGRYEVLKELGRGGAGKVLLARDRKLDRRVAMKVLLGEGTDLARVRFVDEAQITGKLSHPNIVSVHTLAADGDELFMVMKRVHGRDLKQLTRELYKQDPIAQAEYPLRRRLRLFLKVCEAIAYAHHRGVIHRDLKPANTMVGQDDEVVVLDWGLAKPFAREETVSVSASVITHLNPELIRSRLRESMAVARQLSGGEDIVNVSGEITVEGAIVGTPAYMPPEQADNAAALDARADVYALGSMLYELLTFEAPYRGSTYQALRKLLEGPPPPPGERAPDNEVPAPLESIVARAMAREPGDRYPDAAALAKDVERYLDGERVSAHVETAGEALRRLAERHKVAVVLSGVSFLLVNLLIVAAALLVLGEEEQVRAATSLREQLTTKAREQEREARAATRLVELASRAREEASGARRAVAAFRRLANSSVPIERPQGEAGERSFHAATLLEVHTRTRTRLARHRGAVTTLLERWEQHQAAHGGTQAKLPLRTFVAEVDGLTETADRILADTLLARAPAKALEKLPGLRLGDEAALYETRALWRARGRREALTRVRDVTNLPQGSPHAAALGALRLKLAERPLKQQRQAFDAAIAQTPLRAWLYLRRAEVRALSGDFDGAEEDYARATQLQRVDAWIYSSRILHTYAPYADRRLTGHTVRFIKVLAPSNREAEVVHALTALWRFGNLNGYLQKVDGRLEVKAITPLVAWQQKARGALLVLEADRARGFAQRALALQSGDRAAQGYLGEALVMLQRSEQALAVTGKALKRFPDDGRLNQVHGWVLYQLGRAQEALPFLERGARPALTSDPWRRLAECLEQASDAASWARGVRAAQRGLSLDPLATFSYHPKARPIPGDPRLHRVLGQLRQKQGQLVAAALHFVRAYRFSSFQRPVKAIGLDLSDALRAGRVHEQLGLPNEAVQFYAWARRDPKLQAEATRRINRLTRGR